MEIEKVFVGNANDQSKSHFNHFTSPNKINPRYIVSRWNRCEGTLILIYMQNHSLH